MKIKQGAQRQVVMAVVAVAAGLSIAACGSSSNTNTKSSSSGSAGGSTTQTTTTPPAGASAFAAQRAKLEACLKSHGVTLPQRSASGGYGGYGGYGGGYPGGGYPGAATGTTPAPGTGTTGQGFHPGAGGGFFRRFGGANSKFAKALKACGAQFGGAGGFGAGRRFTPHYSKTTLDSFIACVKQHGYLLPAPNTSGTGPIFPRKIESNKQFQAAAKSCESILQSAFRGYPGAAGPGGNPPGTAPPTASGSGTTAST